MEHSETDRLGACLRRLVRYVDRHAVALTGGVAIEQHLSARGLPPCRRVLNDVDVVSRSEEAISRRITGEFLVSHFHRPQPGYAKFLVQLVDPVSRLRVDIFPGSTERAHPCDVRGTTARVLDLEAILDHKIAVLAGASGQRPVDEKHDTDAVRLGRLCGREIAALPAAVLCREAYSRDTAAACPRCAVSADPAFPLAPKRQILDVLGYV
jgi:hypothetical protein